MHNLMAVQWVDFELNHILGANSRGARSCQEKDECLGHARQEKGVPRRRRSTTNCWRRTTSDRWWTALPSHYRRVQTSIRA